MINICSPTIAFVTPTTVPVKVGEAIGAFKANASKTAFCDGAIAVVPSLMSSATAALAAVDTAAPTNAVVVAHHSKRYLDRDVFLSLIHQNLSLMLFDINQKLLYVSNMSGLVCSPTIAFVTPTTVPVKVGEAIGAFKANASKTAFCDGAIAVVPSLMSSATEALAA